jgi:hypothetical protein
MRLQGKEVDKLLHGLTKREARYLRFALKKYEVLTDKSRSCCKMADDLGCSTSFVLRLRHELIKAGLETSRTRAKNIPDFADRVKKLLRESKQPYATTRELYESMGIEEMDMSLTAFHERLRRLERKDPELCCVWPKASRSGRQHKTFGGFPARKIWYLRFRQPEVAKEMARGKIKCIQHSWLPPDLYNEIYSAYLETSDSQIGKIYRELPASISEISKRLEVPYVNIRVALDHLLQKGLVERKPSGIYERIT